MRPAVLILTASAALVALLACSGPSTGTSAPPPRAEVSVDPAVRHVDVEQLPKLIRLSENLYSGAMPSGPAWVVFSKPHASSVVSPTSRHSLSPLCCITSARRS